jgi:hypothetical protein
MMVRVNHAGDNHMSTHINDLVSGAGKADGFANLFNNAVASEQS